MDFGSLAVGTRRASSVTSLASLQSQSSISAGVGHGQESGQTERRRSSILSLASNDIRRRSSAINLNFESRKGLNKAVDEPILLCKENEGYLFFSMTSDGMLNYKVASKVQGSMSKYLINPNTFNTERAPVVVLSSPKSGSGLAQQTYTRLLLPILKHFKIAHSHIALKDVKTASYLAVNGQFTANTIFILLCGDGVVHEVVNGLAKNPHFEQCNTTIKICPIPTGSGNGLSTSLKIHNIAQGIRAIFKNNFQPLPVMSVSINDHVDLLYAAVVVSFGLHAALVRDCESEEYKQRYGGNRFQEVAKKHLNPSPYLYQANLKLLRAARFPDFAGRQADMIIGDGKHSYCLITRCSNLEGDWKIAPFANPLAENGKLDVVRMGNLSGSELGSVLMDAYKAGAQINRESFEYYRASEVSAQMLESDQSRRLMCVDGTIIDVQPNDVVRVKVCPSVGPMDTVILVQHL